MTGLVEWLSILKRESLPVTFPSEVAEEATRGNLGWALLLLTLSTSFDPSANKIALDPDDVWGLTLDAMYPPPAIPLMLLTVKADPFLPKFLLDPSVPLFINGYFDRMTDGDSAFESP